VILRFGDSAIRWGLQAELASTLELAKISSVGDIIFVNLVCRAWPVVPGMASCAGHFDVVTVATMCVMLPVVLPWQHGCDVEATTFNVAAESWVVFCGVDLRFAPKHALQGGKQNMIEALHVSDSHFFGTAHDKNNDRARRRKDENKQTNKHSNMQAHTRALSRRQTNAHPAHAHAHAHVHTHAHERTFTRTHAHAHARTHTHTHARARANVWPLLCCIEPIGPRVNQSCSAPRGITQTAVM
jgi:hypothetical protein